MKVLRYFVSTRKKQWRIFIVCLILAITGYFLWFFNQWESYIRSNEQYMQNISLIGVQTSVKTLSIDRLPTRRNKGLIVASEKPQGTLKPSYGERTLMSKTTKLPSQSHNIKNLLLSKVSNNVHIFYYPWYGNPTTDGKYLHWNHQYLPHWNSEIAKQYKKGVHVPPDDIGSDFYPELGCYSSSDDSTIREHMKQIRTSGAGVVVVSWYPRDKADQQGIPVDKLVPKLLNIADEFKLKITLHIEPYKGRNEKTVRDDAIYIHKRYAKHPAFYKYRTREGRYLPLLYIYDSYHTKPHEWANLLKPDGKYTIRDTPYDCVMIALMVEFNHKDYIDIGGFDGFYTYFAVNGFTYGSRLSAWPKLKSFAVQTNSIFIPSVGPGYIDTSIRPWNDANTRQRENGEYYKRSFKAALSVQPPIISVTSFNEWHEGTQIEKAIPKSGNGFTYKDYLPNGPDYYLKLTRMFVGKFQKWDTK
ncbi:glycoprotein endo-alpha-1,2-mannosidase-like [Dendronephthya gigantea]|uniref:glycoprotein endo-alpha-1,2-mannosidase-like n=1 Tax=Dendronephthya gigantea TaxID=151771 RepID=UPI00106C63F9|nr:glycoprotein endo-alpha-1,2-mannosidase-like [Dendronephthya gigantea]